MFRTAIFTWRYYVPTSQSIAVLRRALRIDAMGNERRRRFFNLSVEKQSIRIAIPFFWLMAAFENGFEIRPFVADPSISMTSLTITICTAYQFRSEARKYAAIFRQGKINDSSLRFPSNTHPCVLFSKNRGIDRRGRCIKGILEEELFVFIFKNIHLGKYHKTG